MKNTKIIFSGFMAAILGVNVANAAGIASQDYVDRKVGDVNTALADKVGSATYEADKATFETKAHAAEIYAPKATTLAGYGITDAYTDEEVDSKVAAAVAGDMAEALGAYVKGSDLTTTLQDYVKGDSLETTLGDYETATTASAKYATKDTENVAGNAASAAATNAAAIGTLSELTVSEDAKGSLVAAINEVKDQVDEDYEEFKVVKNAAESLSSRVDRLDTTVSAENTGLKTKVSNIEATVNDTESGLNAVKTLATNAGTAAAEAKSAADANTAKFADYAKTAELGALAKAAPGDCGSSENKCVLTFDGSAYEWEVVAR